MSTTAPANGRLTTTSLLRRVKIRNYKSLVHCDVELGPLTLLVGRNGSGKSNFLEALSFVAESLRSSLNHAINSRGGLAAVWNSKRLSLRSNETLAIELDLNVTQERRAVYGFELAVQGPEKYRVYYPEGQKMPSGSVSWYQVAREHLEIKGPDESVIASFEVRGGALVGQTERVMPPLAPDRLYLANAAGLPVFRDVHDALLMIRAYNFSPPSMRAPQFPTAGDALRPDGANIAGVIGRIGAERPDLKDRIKQYLGAIVPGLTDVDRVELGPVETLVFVQTTDPGMPILSREFFANVMSDGTLRALGALVAVAQLANGGVPVRLVGIEEPETALHPAAAGVLMDALREAAVHTQIVVTTHSPDLLDQLDPETDLLLVVQARDGETKIGPIDSASREAIKEHLFSPGELLRMDQLEADQADLQRQRQMKSFEASEGSA